MCNAKYTSLSYYYENGKIYEDVCCKFPKRFEIDNNGHNSSYINDRCSYCDLKAHHNSFSIEKGIQSLFIRMGNKCNIKCLMCNDFYCDKFGELQENEEYEYFYLSKIEELKHSLKEIAIIGGETLLYRDQIIKIIDIIKDCDISLTINTNLTIYDEELFSLLFGKVKKLNCIVSIDGYESNEKIRVGTGYIKSVINNYNKIYKNKIYETQNIIINTVISKLNINTIDYEYSKILNELCEIDEITYTILISPLKFSIYNKLNEENKSIYVEKLINIKSITENKGIKYNNCSIEESIMKIFLEEVDEN